MPTLNFLLLFAFKLGLPFIKYKRNKNKSYKYKASSSYKYKALSFPNSIFLFIHLIITVESLL